MKPFTKVVWDRVIEKACDIANATRTHDDPMYEVHRAQMFEILDELEKEFGPNSWILDTRADYVDDPHESRRLRTKALELAMEHGDQEEIDMILRSTNDPEGGGS